VVTEEKIMDKMHMSKTGVIHVWLYGFIPKVIGSRFRVQGSGFTVQGSGFKGYSLLYKGSGFTVQG